MSLSSEANETILTLLERVPERGGHVTRADLESLVKSAFAGGAISAIKAWESGADSESLKREAAKLL